MSEEALRRFLNRLNIDAAFRDKLQTEPESALAEFELSPAERVALTTRDEDALRRLLGADVSGFAFALGVLRVASSACTHCGGGQVRKLPR